jgi:RNA polymerase sigma factor (sigma-70 family)
VNLDAHHESNDEWAARTTRAVRSGSREALAEIYDRCAEDIVQFVRTTTRRDESFSLDCLQEMFMRLAANPPIVDAHAALLAWMRVTALNIARNTVIAETRRARRESARRTDPRIDSESTEPLDDLLARLDTEERALLRLRHAEGMRIKSIAAAVGATPQAIESALRRIVARIRQGGAA